MRTFHMYLIGCKLRIITDHKPLLTIWNKLNPPLKIEWWDLRLLPYKYTIEHEKGVNNIADFLSRHPVMTRDKKSITD